MSRFEPDAISDEEKTTPTPLWQNLLFGVLVVLAVLVVAAAVLYNFGSMWTPSAETKAAYAELAEQGAVPHEVDAQFHIPIPGCTCHSDDPVVVMQHSTRRINECSSCHGG